MRMQGQANCPLNERRQIKANSTGGTATASARRTSMAFAAERKLNRTPLKGVTDGILPANTLGLQTMEQRLIPARIEIDWRILPSYVDLHLPINL